MNKHDPHSVMALGNPASVTAQADGHRVLAFDRNCYLVTQEASAGLKSPPLIYVP